ncbi:PilZ domain-containing protein [Consotaella aegiceratis]|uniref:PilZ domain-containing protein n=1 Tax=Consotaella aegiceratis TaxID=3097961 RepID=UPI002F40422F
MLDRRGKGRRRVILGATLTSGPTNSAQTVRLRNVTETGAEIVLLDGTIDVAEVEIQLPGEDRTRRARVVWHEANRFGLQFISAYEAIREEANAAFRIDAAHRL